MCLEDKTFLMPRSGCVMCERLVPVLQDFKDGSVLPTRYEVLLKYPRKPQWWASNRDAGIC